MKRLAALVLITVPALLLVAAPLLADVKTRDRTTVKFESRVLNFFLGKAAKEGLQSTMAVKGNRKATFNDTTGKIIDLSEEKVYDLDMKKKTYTVTTFDELRRRMREQADKAQQQAEKEEPGQAQEAQKQEKPQKEYEIDFDVKDTGQKKQIAGYDTHETIVTITVREKGKKVEESGGLIMTNDMWLGPKIPQLKENAEFEMRYWKQLEGSQMPVDLSPEQAATTLKMFPLIAKANDRLAKDSDKLAGTPLDVTSTIESVKSPDQMTQAQAQQNNQSTGGGIGGMLAKKMMKKDEPKQRSTIMTTHHEILEVATTVPASDLAIPPDFKEKK